MPPAAEPALSAVLCVDRTETGAETIADLRREAGRVPLELVLVGIDGRRPEPPQGAQDFAAVRLVAHPDSELPAARVTGVRAASAPYVVITETHCFPEPGWAEGLVKRLEEGWVGVGPRIVPANPTRRAVAMTLFDYGRWMSGPAGIWSDLPGHNSAYRRDALLAALGRFPDGMDAETVMQGYLRAAGGELYLDLGVRVRHMNVESMSAASREWRAFSRVYAVRRATHWGAARRTVYAGGSPLLPPIRFARVVAAARRGGYLAQLLRGIDILAVAIVSSAFGELLGYATMRCDPSATLDVELHRRRWAPNAP